MSSDVPAGALAQGAAEVTAVEMLDPGLLVKISADVVRALADTREEVDALNVFPVPDGDTGTNLYLTFEAAHGELCALLQQDPSASMGEVAASYARALLLAARGNSGVIMSQLFGALVRRMVQPGKEPLPTTLADAMSGATRAAYAAVGQPVEGTILTVSRAASDAATAAAAREGATLVRVLRASSRAARDALEHTPEQLATLRRAGVVDAGGRGLCVVLDAIEASLTGRRRSERALPRPLLSPNRPLPDLSPADDLTEDGPAYEVMYLLDADEAAIPDLRRRLQALGDSLVVVGGERLWNVHVHVDDVGAALEAGIEAGRPHRVRVTHFAEQVAARAVRPRQERRGRAVVAVAAGDGLARVLAQAGAHVVAATSTSRPGTADLEAAVVGSGAAEVVLLPNDRITLQAAEAAARRAEEDHGIRVAVVPTVAQVQGLAALAVHDPGRTFESDLVEMAAAARHARSGGVTVSDRRAMTMAGPCEPGDVLGLVEGDFAIVGDDELEVATAVVDLLVGGGGELVTIVAGREGADLATRCAAYVRGRHPHVDVVEYDGGQDRYLLLLGVE